MEGFDLEERVRNGIKALDEYDPQWRERVNVDRLDVGSLECCVLGQLFGNWHFISNLEQLKISPSESCSFGFESYDTSTDPYEGLTEAWKKELAT